MKTVTQRLLPLLLVLLMVGGLLVSCASNSDKPSDSKTTTASNGGIIDPGDDSNDDNSDPYYDNYTRDDLPEELNYGGKTFTILCDQGQYAKSFVEADTGDTVGSALYTRAARVRERLGVEFNIVREPGAYAGMETFTQKMMNGAGEYDLVLSYNLTPATMAIQGLARDLTSSSTPYVNFEKPWWSAELLNNVSIDGRVFFTGDNSSWNNLRNMLGIFVDKNLFVGNHSDMTIDDLYDLVENKQWTMEKMFELTEGCYRDDGDNVVSKDNDTFGLSVGNSVWQEAWYFAAGYVTLSKNDAGEWNFSMIDSNATDFISWLQGKLYGSNDFANYDSKQYQMFKESRVQFYLSALSMVEQELTQPFAVLPLPMYNAGTQEHYSTHFSNTYDMYVIPTGATDPEMSSAVLECLASEAYRRIAPAYFENYLKKRNASDSRLKDMYDIIRAGIVFDAGTLFGELFVKDNNPLYFVRRALNRNTGWENITTKWTAETNAQYLELWKQNLKKLEELPQ